MYKRQVFSNVASRLADSILEHRALGGTDNLTITHDALARDIGTAREVVTRLLKQFQTDGLVRLTSCLLYTSITKKEQYKIGYCGAIANKQYEYDHRLDQALFMDKGYIERKLDVLKNVYEKHKDQAAMFAGPAVMELSLIHI